MVRSSLLAALAVLSVAASAHASTVALEGNTAVFTDAGSHDDTLTLRRTADGLRVYDAIDDTLGAGAGCGQVSRHVVQCPGTPDFRAACGAGFDQVIGVDRTTFLDRTCESIRTQDEELLTLSAQPLSVRPRTVRMRITCPDYAINDFGEYSPCEGTVRLWRNAKLVATARFDTGSYAGKRVDLHLTTLGRRLVRRGPAAVLVAVDMPGYESEGPARARWRIVLDRA